ncbi:MAG TPA: hypothetical protein VGZ26_01655, partial [Pirellulales bacterium]|nr:hypothetical protein [Pirellulales bacterium]
MRLNGCQRFGGYFAIVVYGALSTWVGLPSAQAAPPAKPDPLDWPAWRGPEQNGISRETGII